MRKRRRDALGGHDPDRLLLVHEVDAGEDRATDYRERTEIRSARRDLDVVRLLGLFDRVASGEKTGEVEHAVCTRGHLAVEVAVAEELDEPALARHVALSIAVGVYVLVTGDLTGHVPQRVGHGAGERLRTHEGRERDLVFTHHREELPACDRGVVRENHARRVLAVAHRERQVVRSRTDRVADEVAVRSRHGVCDGELEGLGDSGTLVPDLDRSNDLILRNGN